MPFPWKVLGGTAATGVAGTGLFFVYLTHGIEIVSMQASDTIFHSKFHAAYNPNGNPTIHDLHVIRVPLHRIEPGLREDQEKLLERFCGGVWAGIGFAPHRILLSLIENRDGTKPQLWTRPDLLHSQYSVGTDIAGNFEVIDRTASSILIRGGGKTSVRGVRPLDALMELGASIDRENNIVEFAFKSLFFQGLGVSREKLMPAPVVWLHEQYAKAMLGGGVRYVLK
ncbi:hypothetical protein BJX68DRAFT_8906 [Aspergillus pseudodeflectus]|uniref:Uncharacterized protein n=1 Tax=Aspergillus pseudodeflectus TaxID=176178 RepID=A0ABR4LB75_9EURO